MSAEFNREPQMPDRLNVPKALYEVVTSLWEPHHAFFSELAERGLLPNSTPNDPDGIRQLARACFFNEITVEAVLNYSAGRIESARKSTLIDPRNHLHSLRNGGVVIVPHTIAYQRAVQSIASHFPGRTSWLTTEMTGLTENIATALYPNVDIRLVPIGQEELLGTTDYINNGGIAIMAADRPDLHLQEPDEFNTEQIFGFECSLPSQPYSFHLLTDKPVIAAVPLLTRSGLKIYLNSVYHTGEYAGFYESVNDMSKNNLAIQSSRSQIQHLFMPVT